MDTLAEYNETTSAGVRKARREKGFNQDELGEMVGVSRQTINAYENGRQTIPIHMIYKLAEALDVQPSDLMEVSMPEDVIGRATEACTNLANLLLRAADK